MADFPALPLFTDAYLADTAHLTDAEHGRYLRLLMLIWRSPDCRVPNDDEWLARRFSRSIEETKEQFRPLIIEFCKCDGNWITQKRLLREMAFVRKRSKKQSVRSKARWDKEKKPSRGNATARNAHSGNPPTPTPTPTEDSEAIASAPDGAIAFDTKAAIFGEQLAWLRENTGKAEGSLRSWLGKCCGEYGEVETLAAILNIRSNPTPVDPISRMRSILERQGTRNGTGKTKLSAVEGIYAGFAIELGERERQADRRADSDAPQPLLDSRDAAGATDAAKPRLAG